jgi:hypothetical protein
VIDATLASYATVRQLEYLEALDKAKSLRGAARALKLHPKTIKESMKSLEAKAAAKGHSPAHDMTHTVPDGFKVKGVSSLYVDGKLSSQWVKSTADQERRDQLIREAFEAMAQELPRLEAQPPMDRGCEQLATLYTLTDSHVGMLAWAKEGGDDWDLTIAEKTLVGCFAAASLRWLTHLPRQRWDSLTSLGTSCTMTRRWHPSRRCTAMFWTRMAAFPRW